MPVDGWVLSPYWRQHGRIARWEILIIKWARQFWIDPDLVAAVMLHESGGNPDAVSHSGAVGLMQVMPSNNRKRPDLSIPGRSTHERLLIPEVAIADGVFILAQVLQANAGDARRALAEYNCGAYGLAHNLCGARGGYAYADDVLRIHAAAKAATSR